MEYLPFSSMTGCWAGCSAMKKKPPLKPPRSCALHDCFHDCPPICRQDYLRELLDGLHLVAAATWCSSPMPSTISGDCYTLFHLIRHLLGCTAFYFKNWNSNWPLDTADYSGPSVQHSLWVMQCLQSCCWYELPGCCWCGLVLHSWPSAYFTSRLAAHSTKVSAASRPGDCLFVDSASIHSDTHYFWAGDCSGGQTRWKSHGVGAGASEAAVIGRCSACATTRLRAEDRYFCLFS